LLKKINEQSSNDLHNIKGNGHKRGISELTSSGHNLLKGVRNDTGLHLNTIADQGDIHIERAIIKQSKSSMNKTVGKKPLNLNHPKCGKVRHQPISIWDQIQVHDSQLYQ
jgi:hypothetical protein